MKKSTVFSFLLFIAYAWYTGSAAAGIANDDRNVGEEPSYRDFFEDLKTRPYPFSSVSEFDVDGGEFFGISSVSGTKMFVSVQAAGGKRRVLGRIPRLDGLLRNASTLDRPNKRFFFIGWLQEGRRLCAISTGTGEIETVTRLSLPVNAIEYDPHRRWLWGFCRLNGGCHLVSVNTQTGTVTKRKALPHFTHISKSMKLTQPRQRLFFIGHRPEGWHFCFIETRSESLNILKGEEVEIDAYRVVSFAGEEADQALFTREVQSCTGLAGYDSLTQVGVVAHFSYPYKDIKHDLEKIEREIQKSANGRGLRHMEIAVVGGIKNNPQSVSNLHLLYKELVMKYGVNFRDILKYNTGTSHILAIFHGKVMVF